MPCCGGSRKVKYQPKSKGEIAPLRIEVSLNMNTVDIEYMGKRIGAFTIFGSKTKRAYRFSTFNRVVQVAVVDANQVISSPEFRIKQVGVVVQSLPIPPRGSPALLSSDMPHVFAESSVAAKAAHEASKPPVVSVDPVATPQPVVAKPTVKATDQNVRIARVRDERGTKRVDPRKLLGR